jgi:hypothetical protein
VAELNLISADAKERKFSFLLRICFGDRQTDRKRKNDASSLNPT